MYNIFIGRRFVYFDIVEDFQSFEQNIIICVSLYAWTQPVNSEWQMKENIISPNRHSNTFTFMLCIYVNSMNVGESLLTDNISSGRTWLNVAELGKYITKNLHTAF